MDDTLWLGQEVRSKNLNTETTIVWRQRTKWVHENFTDKILQLGNDTSLLKQGD